jgi:hypothetical protein
MRCAISRPKPVEHPVMNQTGVCVPVDSLPTLVRTALSLFCDMDTSFFFDELQGQALGRPCLMPEAK